MICSLGIDPLDNRKLEDMEIMGYFFVGLAGYFIAFMSVLIFSFNSQAIAMTVEFMGVKALNFNRQEIEPVVSYLVKSRLEMRGIEVIEPEDSRRVQDRFDYRLKGVISHNGKEEGKEIELRLTLMPANVDDASPVKIFSQTVKSEDQIMGAVYSLCSRIALFPDTDLDSYPNSVSTANVSLNSNPDSDMASNIDASDKFKKKPGNHLKSQSKGGLTPANAPDSDSHISETVLTASSDSEDIDITPDLPPEDDNPEQFDNKGFFLKSLGGILNIVRGKGEKEDKYVKSGHYEHIALSLPPYSSKLPVPTPEEIKNGIRSEAHSEEKAGLLHLPLSFKKWHIKEETKTGLNLPSKGSSNEPSNKIHKSLPVWKWF